MKYCSSCGKQLSDDARFCSGCGKTFAETTFSENHQAPSTPARSPLEESHHSAQIVACLISMALGFIALCWAGYTYYDDTSKFWGGYTYKSPLTDHEMFVIFIAIIGAALFFGSIIDLIIAESKHAKYVSSAPLRSLGKAKCPGCGCDVEVTLYQCPQCGFRLKEKKIEPRRVESNQIVCPFCKQVYPKGTIYCSRCGAQVGSRS